MEVTDRQGKVRARMPLSATYGTFEIVPADLVDGPGDELRRKEFAATSSGYFEGAVCRLHEEEFERLTTLKRDHVLRFLR